MALLAFRPSPTIPALVGGIASPGPLMTGGIKRIPKPRRESLYINASSIQPAQRSDLLATFTSSRWAAWSWTLIRDSNCSCAAAAKPLKRPSVAQRIPGNFRKEDTNWVRRFLAWPCGTPGHVVGRRASQPRPEGNSVR